MSLHLITVLLRWEPANGKSSGKASRFETEPLCQRITCRLTVKYHVQSDSLAEMLRFFVEEGW